MSLSCFFLLFLLAQYNITLSCCCFTYWWVLFLSLSLSLSLSLPLTHTHTHTQEMCEMSQTAVLLLQCFAFQINDSCFLLRGCNPDLKQPYVCSVSHFHGRQLVFWWLFSSLSLSLSLSRDLPVRGRYEVRGLPLDPLVSPGGKLSFSNSRNAVRYLPYVSFCPLRMLCAFKPYRFKHRIQFSLNGHIICCGLVVFFSQQKNSHD